MQSAIDEYAARTGRYQDREVMAGLRHDAKLRLAVGVRLLDKIDNYTHTIRIGNGEKAPTARGYEKMTSKDYVASLVLAMADGTFKSNESDAIVTNNVGVATAGLHRTAALDVLRGDFKNL